MAAKIEDALYTRLSGFTALTDLVSLRMYHAKLESGTLLPAVTWQRTNEERDKLSGADNATRAAFFTIECWGGDIEEARDVAEQVVAALDRYSGTDAGVVIDQGFIEDEHDDFDDDVTNNDGEPGVPKANVEVKIWYEAP